MQDNQQPIQNPLFHYLTRLNNYEEQNASYIMNHIRLKNQTDTETKDLAYSST